MINRSAFEQLVKEIQDQGYGEQAAAHFATLIGDTPIKDEDGFIIVREHGQVLARLHPLRFFGG